MPSMRGATSGKQTRPAGSLERGSIMPCVCADHAEHVIGDASGELDGRGASAARQLARVWGDARPRDIQPGAGPACRSRGAEVLVLPLHSALCSA